MAELVTAPTRRPRSGGIKDVVPEFTSEPRLSLLFGDQGIAWEDSGCGLPSPTRAGCYDEGVAPADKTAEGIEPYTAAVGPFALYKGVQCYIGGDNEGPSYEEQATAVLIAGEDRGIEAQLMNWLQNQSSASRPNLVEALGYADTYADLTYVGQPVIWIARRDSADLLAAGAIVRENDRLWTANGNPVVSTSSLPPGMVGVTGAIAVYASEIVTGLGRELSENIAMGLAERVYAVGVDCDFGYLVTVVAP